MLYFLFFGRVPPLFNSQTNPTLNIQQVQFPCHAKIKKQLLKNRLFLISLTLHLPCCNSPESREKALIAVVLFTLMKPKRFSNRSPKCCKQFVDTGLSLVLCVHRVQCFLRLQHQSSSPWYTAAAWTVTRSAADPDTDPGYLLSHLREGKKK